MQGLNGGGICGGAQDDSAWASGRGATDLENLGHRGIAVDISHGLPGQGRPAELPGGGMPGPSDNRGNKLPRFLHRYVMDTMVIMED